MDTQIWRSPSSSANVGAVYKFISHANSGALVVLKPPGISTNISARLRIVNYMRDNFANWLEFANSVDSRGLGLRDEELIFISGTIKTTHWAVAAFQGDSYRDQQGAISGNLGPLASVGLSIKISDHILPTDHYRTGPIRIQRSGGPPFTSSHSEPPASTSVLPQTQDVIPEQADQCLFIHYYKMKRRRFHWTKKPMKAASGLTPPLGLKDNPEDDDDATPLGGYVCELGCAPDDEEVCGVSCVVTL